MLEVLDHARLIDAADQHLGLADAHAHAVVEVLDWPGGSRPPATDGRNGTRRR
jgi:hypothetical protein